MKILIDTKKYICQRKGTLMVIASFALSFLTSFVLFKYRSWIWINENFDYFAVICMHKNKMLSQNPFCFKSLMNLGSRKYSDNINKRISSNHQLIIGLKYIIQDKRPFQSRVVIFFPNSFPVEKFYVLDDMRWKKRSIWRRLWLTVKTELKILKVGSFPFLRSFFRKTNPI